MRILLLVDKVDRKRMLPDWAITELGKLGKLTFEDNPGLLSEKELASRIAGHNILLTGWNSQCIPISILNNSQSKLQYICHLTGRMKKTIPLDFVQSGAIIVTNWGSAISKFVAETALTLLLACTRRLRYRFEEIVNRGGWKGEFLHGGTLFYRRVGIYGFGSIGRSFAELIKPFKPKIFVYDPYANLASFQGIEKVNSLNQLFEKSEYISIHAGLTKDTIGTVDRDRLILLPDDAILVNTARGAIINENDLIDILNKKNLWVGMDVHSQEPLPTDSPLRYLENVIITPHLGSKVGQEQANMIANQALSNIRRFIRGEKLDAVITADKYAQMT